MVNFLDKGLDEFIEKTLSTVVNDIDIDYIKLLPKKSELFVQSFLKDSKGELVVNEAVHNLMHRFIRFARKNGFEKFLCLGAFGQGKCLLSFTPVLMYDLSFKMVQDIVVGDILMGPDSKPRTVLFLGNGEEPAYRITLSNGDYFGCNESHKLSLKVSRDFYVYKRGETVTLLLTEYLELPEWIKKHCLKAYKVPLDFDEQEVPIDPYEYGKTIGDFRIKHGDAKTQFYTIWMKMKERCDNPNLPYYDCYGGRGIVYNVRWGNYLEFKKDMYFKYLYAKKQLKIKNISIERINPDGDYCFDNCIFIDLKDQIKNTRRNKWFKATSSKGKEYKSNSQSDFAKQHDLEQTCISSFLRGKRKKAVNGWIFEYIENPNKKYQVSKKRVSLKKKEGIAHVYLKNSRVIRLQVLAGYLDVHGSINKGINAESYRTVTKSETFRDDLLFLCRSLGFSVKWHTEKYGDIVFYRITISGIVREIPCKIKKVEKVKRSRKKRKALEYSFKVEPLGIKKYYGFGLDKDHLFLHKSFTVIHNTEQLCTGYAMYRIAKNPNILIKIVHVSESESVKRCRALRDYITKDDDLKRIAPHIRPTPIWGSQRFIVDRTAMSKDGTVEAYGVLSTAIGGRANLIIFDDPQDLKTAVYEPTTRAKIEDTFKNIWLTRLIPSDSEALVMMNSWHQCSIKSDVYKQSGELCDLNGVKKDDSVFTSDGFSNVLATTKSHYEGKSVNFNSWDFTAFENEYTEDHRVMTQDGWKKAIELTTADYLVTPIYKFTGDWLLEAKKTYPENYEYKSKKNKKRPNVVITEAELTERLNKSISYKEIAKEFEMAVGSVFNLARYYGINNERANTIDKNILEDCAFWRILGLWVAEGSFTWGDVADKRHCIRFTFGSHEHDYINEVRGFFGKYGIHVGEDTSHASALTLKISSFQLAQWLSINFGDGSYNLKLPEWFFGLPENLFFNFLNGYFDGDGNITNGREDAFSSVSKQLLFGIQMNLLRFGIIASLTKATNGGIKECDFGAGLKKVNTKAAYQLRLSTNIRNFAYIKDGKLYSRLKTIVIKDYVGDVWDITTSTHDFASPFCIVHNSDLAHKLQRNPIWAWMSIAVGEDKEHLVYEDSFGKKIKYPVWSKFNKKHLITKHKELGDRDFDRGFRLIPYTDADKTFPSFLQCCHFGVSPYDIISERKNWFFIGGLDFASTKRPGNVLTILAVHNKTGMKIPVEITPLRSVSEIPNYMVKYHRMYGIEVFMAENNGVQDSIIELLISALGDEKHKKYNIKIEGFLTGNNKADNIVGLPSINKEFENREWMFCLAEEPGIDADIQKDPWARMYTEFKNHPFFELTDIVMSLWFARSGALQLIRGSGAKYIH